MRRAIVCGGRDFTDVATLERVLDEQRAKGELDFVIQGTARGADTLASEWALKRDVPQAAFPANWHLYGKSAGPIRNRQMIVDGRADYVIAFPGGAGTKDMVKQARRFDLPVLVVDKNGVARWP